MKRAVVVVLAVMMAVALAAAQEQGKPEPAAKPEVRSAPARHFYKVDLAIHEVQNGKRVNTRHYTMHLDDSSDRARIKMGSRVPVATGSFGAGVSGNSLVNTQFNYLDVGLNIDCFITRGNELHIEAELSDFAYPEKETSPGLRQPVIRQTRTYDIVGLPLKPGTIVASLDDPSSTKRFEVEATATQVQ